MLLNPKFQDYLIEKYFFTLEEVQQMQTMHFESMFTLLVDEVIKFLEENNMTEELTHIDGLAASKSKGKMFMKTNQKLIRYLVELPNKHEKLAAAVAKRLEDFESESFFEMFDQMTEKQQLDVLKLFEEDIKVLNHNLEYYTEKLKNSDV